MTFTVLNVRHDQTDQLQLVRLLHRNIDIALEALQSRVVFCAPRDTAAHGYVGTAMLLDITPTVAIRVSWWRNWMRSSCSACR